MSEEPEIKVEDAKEEFLAAYNLADNGSLYCIFSPGFFQGKDFTFSSRVKDWQQILWDVREGKIKPTK